MKIFEYVKDSLRDVNALFLISYSTEFLDHIITVGIIRGYLRGLGLQGQ